MTSLVAHGAVLKALQHVRESHPEVDHVTFRNEDDMPGGWWEYSSAGGGVPKFGTEIQTSLLEEALDQAWEESTFPLTYTFPNLVAS